MFDLRLAEAHRGRGLGVPVLRALTELVFVRWPGVTRFEGHTREDNLAMRAAFRGAGWVQEAYYRDGWPVDGAPPLASVADAVLRRDWDTGATTPVVWDDLSSGATDVSSIARDRRWGPSTRERHRRVGSR